MRQYIDKAAIIVTKLRNSMRKKFRIVNNEVYCPEAFHQHSMPQTDSLGKMTSASSGYSLHFAVSLFPIGSGVLRPSRAEVSSVREDTS